MKAALFMIPFFTLSVLMAGAGYCSNPQDTEESVPSYSHPLLREETPNVLPPEGQNRLQTLQKEKKELGEIIAAVSKGYLNLAYGHQKIGGLTLHWMTHEGEKTGAHLNQLLIKRKIIDQEITKIENAREIKKNPLSIEEREINEIARERSQVTDEKGEFLNPSSSQDLR